MIVEIISHLNDIEDMRNCMLLSTDIKDFIYKTPKIMHKIQIAFKSDINLEEISQFLDERGKFIKNIKIQENFKENKIIDPLLIPVILNKCPNIEKFTHASHPDYSVMKTEKIVKYPFELLRLKHLIIETDESGNFIANARNIKNLETLKCFHHKLPINENLTDFLCQQENLKELSLKYSILYAPKSFPTRDIRKEIKFKLNKLNYSINSRQFSPNFIKFLEKQAENLIELNLFGIIELEIYEIIFKKCKNLEKLSIFPQEGSYSYTNDHHDWMLSNLRYFESEKLRFDYVYKKFPNIDSIKCSQIEKVEGTFEKLLNLDIKNLNENKFISIMLPNLRTLNVSSVDLSTFEQLIRNSQKIESISVIDYSKCDKSKTFLNILKKLQKLKLSFQ